MQEESKGFGNNYDHEATRQFFRRWWKVLLIVFVLGIIASCIAAWCIKPLYKSSAVIFPTNSNRLSKAIMDYHYSLDFMDYGIERDCEYAIQILSSKRMEKAVCDRFNLMEHYGIPADDEHKLFKLDEQYQSNITVKRTEFLGVEIGVLDQDPQWAADIANYIAANYDTVCHRIHHDRATDAARIMQGVCDDLQQEIRDLQDSMRARPQYAAGMQQLLADKCKELADLQTRAAQTRVDMDQEVSYKFLLDQAEVADKKAYPKRAVIVLLGTFGALVMCILLLLLLDYFKKEEDGENGSRPTPPLS